jgi:hypothetical protein
MSRGWGVDIMFTLTYEEGGSIVEGGEGTGGGTGSVEVHGGGE